MTAVSLEMSDEPIFILIYRPFAQIYVMIFQSVIYNFSSIKKKKGLCSEYEKRIDSGQS